MFRIDLDESEIIDLKYKDYHQVTAMGTTWGVRMKNPAHPGAFVRSKIFEAPGLSMTGAEAALGITRPALSALLNERASLSPEMALRIEKVFGVSMDTLLRMQTSYDIAQTREREDDIDLVPVEARVARACVAT